MNIKTRIINWINANRYLPLVISGLAGVLYSVQAWIFSQQQRSLLDEGNYLLKGYLFVTGKYVPFQDYGPWTNKMPLSFLIPGYIQKIFGPGLSTGRYYAFSISILILIAALVIGYRLGGKWGAALTAVILAFNPAPLKIYTKVLTEGLTALMLLITLLLVLGKDRPLWQILVGSFVAGLIPVTRINLSPILPLVIVYLFWEHGPRKGLYGLLVSLIPIIGLHLVYWPGIFQVWAKWIPAGLIESLDHWKGRFGAFVSIRQPDPAAADRLMAFSQGIRFQFSAVLSIFTAVGLWPKNWPDRSRQRSAIFLLVLFFVLFFIHLTAVVFLDFNIHTLERYLSAFNFLGVFVVLITWDAWNYDLPKWRQIIIGLGMGFFTLVIAYSISEQSSFYGVWIKSLLRNFAIPSEGGSVGIAAWKWWEAVQSRIGWEYSTTIRVATLGLSIIAAIITILALMWIYKRFLRLKVPGFSNFRIPQALISFYVLGILLSPTKLLGSGSVYYDCNRGAIQSYREAVSMTSRFVEPNDRVFWVGKDTQVVLLGLLDEKEIQIYPQQLNAYNSFKIAGNTDLLARAGFWNDALVQEWIDESQVLLFEQQAISGWFEEYYNQIDLSGFNEMPETNRMGCTHDQRIYIYRR